jgi:hypothetical protein
MSLTPRTAALLLAAALTLTACGGGESGGGEGPPASEGGELTFANWQWLEPNRGDAIWETVSGYSAANPAATLAKQEITRKDYENTLKTQMGAGQGPDVLVIPDSFFPELADAGLLEPLGGVLAPEDEAALNATNEAGVLGGRELRAVLEQRDPRRGGCRSSDDPGRARRGSADDHRPDRRHRLLRASPDERGDAVVDRLRQLALRIRW